MGPQLTVKLAEQTLIIVLANRALTVELLHHSDSSSQNAAASYQRKLVVYALRPSISRKNNCWDNACIERFF